MKSFPSQALSITLRVRAVIYYKQGATLVEQTADIVTELAGALAGLRENLRADNVMLTPAFDFDEDQRLLLDIIGFDAVDLCTPSRVSRWPAEKLSQTLVR